MRTNIASDDARDGIGIELAVEIAESFGRVRLRVTGTSMVPAIQPGDILTICRAPIEEISPGDVVAVVRQNRLFVHRALERFRSHEPYLTTRGDRLLRSDPPVSRSDLLGRVISVERNGRCIDGVEGLHHADSVLCRVLRASEWATVLFVRLAALRRALNDEGIAWQRQRSTTTAATSSSTLAG